MITLNKTASSADSTRRRRKHKSQLTIVVTTLISLRYRKTYLRASLVAHLATRLSQPRTQRRLRLRLRLRPRYLLRQRQRYWLWKRFSPTWPGPLRRMNSLEWKCWRLCRFRWRLLLLLFSFCFFLCYPLVVVYHRQNRLCDLEVGVCSSSASAEGADDSKLLLQQQQPQLPLRLTTASLDNDGIKPPVKSTIRVTGSVWWASFPSSVAKARLK